MCRQSILSSTGNSSKKYQVSERLPAGIGKVECKNIILELFVKIRKKDKKNYNTIMSFARLSGAGCRSCLQKLGYKVVLLK